MRLPKHPFPVQTVFRRCLLANMAVDGDAMRELLPRHVEPDLYDGEAYVSVVVGQMDRMRPTFVPKALGITYNQIVYRVVVRCGDERESISSGATATTDSCARSGTQCRSSDSTAPRSPSKHATVDSIST